MGIGPGGSDLSQFFKAKSRGQSKPQTASNDYHGTLLMESNENTNKDAADKNTTQVGPNITNIGFGENLNSFQAIPNMGVGNNMNVSYVAYPNANSMHAGANSSHFPSTVGSNVQAVMSRTGGSFNLSSNEKRS